MLLKLILSAQAEESSVWWRQNTNNWVEDRIPEVIRFKAKCDTKLALFTDPSRKF